MHYGNYTFTCRMDDDTILPAYKGSTFRGVFGHALRHVACALKRQTCDDCLLVKRCIYPYVFETHLARSTREGENVSTVPHPVILCPDTTTQTHFKAGDTLSVNVLLFGDVNESLPFFIYAFEEMGKRGIGKRVQGRRGSFTLTGVTFENTTVYTPETGRITVPRTLPDIFFEEPFVKNTDSAVLDVRVNFETPMRIKFDKDIPDTLDFRTLVRQMLRRMSSMMNHYGPGEPPLDYKGMVERASDVSIAANALTWLDWKRYSSRQDQKMFMGGFTGSITYQGRLGEYLQLLDIASKIHIGKNTVFGLGKISCEILG
jgi:hypothetical protein